MRHKLILSFLFFEMIVFCTETRRIHRDETFIAPAKFRESRSAAARFALISPRQIRRAEITIGHFLARLSGLIVPPITPRMSFSDGDDWRGTIDEICEIVRAKVTEFARACGLTASVRQANERTSWNFTTLSEDWLSEGLIQGSFLLCDLLRLGERIRFAIDHYFDTYNVTLWYNRALSPRKTTKSFKFLGVVNDAFGFNERLFKCLRSISDDERKGAPSFDLNRVLANLARDSPNGTVMAIKSILDRTLSRYAANNDTSGKRLYSLLCHSLVARAGHHGDCVKRLRRLEACVLAPARRDSGKMIVGRTFTIKPWLTAIEDLSGCKIYIDKDDKASVRCDFGGRVPRTTVQRVRYIYEKILDRRISRRSLLHRVAHDLGNALSRSEWGRRFTYDVCQYFAIYQEGRRRLNELWRDAVRDKKAATRYKKLSESLYSYKNGALRKTMLAIDNFHRSALEMQKFFIYDSRNSFNQLWHVTILNYFSDWMRKLLELFGCIKLDDTDVDMSIPTNVSSINATDLVDVTTNGNFHDGSEQMKHFEMYRTKDKIRREANEAFEKLLQSMDRVSSVRSGNDRSTLACLSNNLLLVAMFMETISLVSTLFCLGHNRNESSNTEELKDEWVPPPERDRRSLFVMNYTEIY